MLTFRDSVVRAAAVAMLISVVSTLFAGRPVWAAQASSLLPRANAAWVYDPRDSSGDVQAGAFLDALNQYNLTASPDHVIREIYSYGGDMEMYCPDNDPSQCTGSDLYVFYSRTQPVSGQKDSNVSTYAYHQGVQTAYLSAPPVIAPIIDGVVTGSGPLGGFDQLSATMARHFADKVAHRVCDDPYAAGVEFDLEPFDVRTLNAQYYFYMRIARDFASASTGCVDAGYPQGRFFAIFAGASAIDPASASSGRVSHIVNSFHNGYMIDPLYDLDSTPPGDRTSLSNYQSLVNAQTYNMSHWAEQLGIPYQFGVPGAAAFHEYQSCSGSACSGAAEPADGQVSYLKADESAIAATPARGDGLYLGSALFCFSAGIHYGATSFGPQLPTQAVDFYLGSNL